MKYAEVGQTVKCVNATWISKCCEETGTPFPKKEQLLVVSEVVSYETISGIPGRAYRFVGLKYGRPYKFRADCFHLMKLVVDFTDILSPSSTWVEDE